MAIIDTLRPISTRKTGGGTAVPSGTLDEVTADDDDARTSSSRRQLRDNCFGSPPHPASQPPATGLVNRIRTDANVEILTWVGESTDRSHTLVNATCERPPCSNPEYGLPPLAHY